MKKIISSLILSLMVLSLSADDYCCDEWGSFFVGGNWLNWKVEEQKLQIGANVVQQPSSGSNPIETFSTVLKPDFNTSDGFRVFTGYTTQDQLWESTLIYSHMSSHANSSFFGPPAPVRLAKPVQEDLGNVVFFDENYPLLTPIEITTHYEMCWKPRIDYLDFDLARTFSFCEDFEITPHIGIRATWIRQTVKIEGFNPQFFVMEARVKSYGIGLEGGLYGAWNLPCNFALIGHIGGALTYNRVHNRGSIVVNDFGEIGYNNPNKVSNAWVDAFIGISYSRNFCNYLLNIHAGWEHHMVYNANQFSATGGGDLTMQGLTLGAFIQF